MSIALDLYQAQAWAQGHFLRPIADGAFFDVAAKSVWELELVICVVPIPRSGVVVNLPRCRTQVRISPPDASQPQRGHVLAEW